MRSKKVVSILLSLALMMQLATPAFAAMADTAAADGDLVIRDKNGNIIEENWEEKFPYGTFVFSGSEMTVEEGAQKKITLYRLGGTVGRATAYIQAAPGSTLLDDGLWSHTNAAGKSDYILQAEDPLPIAQYQPIGREPDPLASHIIPEAELSEDGETVTLTVPVKAKSYRWYAWQEAKGWAELDGATDQSLVIGKDMVEDFNYRCVYVKDGIRYSTDGLGGYVYEPRTEDELKPVPDGIELNPGQTFSRVLMEDGEYSAYSFPLVFADGEWMKELIFSAETNDYSEADEFAMFTITGCEGASVYDTANTFAVHIPAHGEDEASVIGFEDTSYRFDKSGLTATLTLTRTGGLLPMQTVNYRTEDGSAKSGRDYTGTKEGTAYFAPGSDSTIIRIDLIDDGIESQDDVNFTVFLTDIKGGSSSSLAKDGARADVFLYNSNSAENVNAATMLFTGDAADLSSSVDEAGALVKSSPAPVALPVINDGKPLYADIDFKNDGLREQSYSYGTINFSRSNIANYYTADQYWHNYAYVARSGAFTYDAKSGYDYDNTAGYMSGAGWSGKGGRGGGLGTSYVVNTQKEAKAAFSPEGALGSEFFDKIMGSYKLRADKVAWIYTMGYSYPGIYLETYPGQQTTGRLAGNKGKVEKSGEFEWNITGYGKFELVLDIIRAGNPDHDAGGGVDLWDCVLKRRVLNNNPQLVIHTADDELLNNSPAVRDSIYSAIKPSVSLVLKKGGVTDSGKLYAGSTVEVSRAPSATYKFAIGSKPLNNSVYLSAGTNYGTIVNPAESVGSDKAQLQLVTSSVTSKIGSDGNYAVNVALDRLQKLEIDLTPSAAKDESGQITSEARTAAANKFWNSTSGITYKYSEYDGVFSGGKYGFEEKQASRYRSSMSQSGSVFSESNVKNLKSINFGLPADWLIVFNGYSYKGNETITLPLSRLSTTTLNYLVYSPDSVTSVNDMRMSVSHVERYIDMNGNGRLDGYHDASVNMFVPTGAVKDILVEVMDEKDYAITNFEPLYINGKYVNQFFKVYYSLTPRSLVAPTGATDNDPAQVLPIFTTNITNETAKSKLSEELRGYRFITSGQYSETVSFGRNTDNSDWMTLRPGGTSGAIITHTKDTYSGDNKRMYTAAASIIETVDVSLGGDHNPIDLAQDANGVLKKNLSGKTYFDVKDWKPDYKGNLLYPFTNPAPAFVNDTVLGDFMPIAYNAAETAEQKKVRINNYLGSWIANNTVIYGVRQQTETTEQIKNPLSQLDGGGLNPVVNGIVIPLNTVNKTGVGSIPGSESLKAMTAQDDKTGSSAKGDSKKSANTMDELNVDLGIELPSLEFGLSDYITVIMDGYEVGFSIGVPLFKAESKTKNYTANEYERDTKNKYKGEVSGPVNENAEAMGNIKNAFKNPSSLIKDDVWKDVKASQTAGEATGDRTIRAGAASVNIAFNVTILFKYNSLDNKFVFNQAMFAVNVGLQYKYTMRLTVCPIVYAYFVIGVSVEVVGGIVVDRVVDIDKGKTKNFALGQSQFTTTGTWKSRSDASAYKGDLISGKEGAAVLAEVYSDTFQISFDGKIGVEIESGQYKDSFAGGSISSDGSEPFVVKLDGSVKGIDGNKTVLKITVLEDDTTLDVLEEIKSVRSDTYFSGIYLTPTLFLEVGVGVGVEVLKVELYIKASISMTMSFATRVEDPAGGYKTEAFSFDSMTFRVGLGLRVTLLLFNFELDLIQFGIDYRKEYDKTRPDDFAGSSPEGFNKDGWKFAWYALNGMEEFDASNSSDGFPGVRITLPANTFYAQQIFGLDDGNSILDQLEEMAYDPSEEGGARGFFQLSGYSSGGDAFKLAENLATGTDYKLATAGDKNYLLYTISRQLSPGASTIDSNLLVMSQVVNTGKNVGLKKPGTEEAGYIIVDEDDTGDLDFAAWAEGSNIHVTWISYKTPFGDYQGLPGGGDAKSRLALAAKNTVIKTAAFSTNNSLAGFGTPVIVDDRTTASDVKNGYKFLPRITNDGAVLFYASSALMDETQKTAADSRHKADYDAATGGVKPDVAGGGYTTATAGDPTAPFRLSYNQSMDSVYGQNSVFNFAVWNDTENKYKLYTWEPPTWKAGGMRLDNVDMTMLGADTFCLAYTAGKTQLQSSGAGADTATVRFLYLQTGKIEGDGSLTLNDAVVLRKLYDAGAGMNASDFGLTKITGSGESKYTGMDGVYDSTGQQVTAFEDPYFSNLKFLTGKLGELSGTAEDFDDTLAGASLSPLGAEPETFLLFEMNGNTYVIPRADLDSITGGSRTGRVIPFFSADAGKGTRGAVTIGADGENNITAVYTDTVPGTTNNAIFIMKYYPGEGSLGQPGYIAPGWGEGRMLAMNYMQVYEDSLSNGWSAEETEAAYLNPDLKGGMRSFAFTNLDVALGHKNTSGGIDGADDPASTLLIISQGTDTKLQKLVYAGNGSEEDAKIIAPKTKDDGSIDSFTGFYAISFGVGEQSIGEGIISFGENNFTPGAALSPTVSFKNTGDLPIRGSEAQPISLKLMLEGEGSPLAEWEIKSSVLVGQTVSTYDERSRLRTAPLPGNLDGRKFYFTLTEDGSYTNKPFTYNSLTAPGGATIEIKDKPELAVEEAVVKTAAVESDKVRLDLSLKATNRGSKDATGVYLQFTYQDEDGNYRPINLTGHRLTVGLEEELGEMAASSSADLTAGKLYLHASNEGSASSRRIEAGYGRPVTGTFTVPKSFYNTDSATGSLNLKIEMFSADGVSQQTLNSFGVVESNHKGEHTAANNFAMLEVEQTTFFEAPAHISVPVGTTLRLYLPAETTKTTAPVMNTTELSTALAVRSDPYLGILYYNSAASCVVITPKEEGEGVIRVSDTSTNSFVDVSFTATAAGSGINIYKDNDIFKFYLKNGTVWTPNTATSQWTFRDNQIAWPIGNEAPYLNNLAFAEKDVYFKFTTMAKEITFFFDGEISVSSSLAGFSTKYYTHSSGQTAARTKSISEGWTVDFGLTTDAPHTVTVKVNSETAAFDKYVEAYAKGAPPTPSDDKQSPQIYWSRSMPDTTSVAKGGSIVLTAYIIDETGIADVTLNGVSVSNPARISETLWQFNHTLTANGSFSVQAADYAGNITARSIAVDWFTVTDGSPANPDSPVALSAEFMQLNGNAIPAGSYVKDSSVKLIYTAPASDGRTELERWVEDGFAEQSLGSTPGEADIAANGIYRITRYAKDGSYASRLLYLSAIDPAFPIVEINEEESSNSVIKYRVSKQSADGAILPADAVGVSPITSVTINGVSQDIPSASTDMALSFDIAYNGKYVIKAADKSGRESTPINRNISGLPIDLAPQGAMSVEHSWNQSGNTGGINIDTTRITGAYYSESLRESSGIYTGSFRFALVKKGVEAAPGDWSAVISNRRDFKYENLAPGEYTLLAQDTNPSARPEPLAELDIVIEDRALTAAAASVAGSDKMTVIAAGGSGRYKFAIHQITGGESDTDLSWFDLSAIGEPQYDKVGEIEVPNPIFDPEADEYDPRYDEDSDDFDQDYVNGNPQEATIVVDIKELSSQIGVWLEADDAHGLIQSREFEKLPVGKYLVAVREYDDAAFNADSTAIVLCSVTRTPSRAQASALTTRDNHNFYLLLDQDKPVISAADMRQIIDANRTKSILISGANVNIIIQPGVLSYGDDLNKMLAGLLGKTAADGDVVVGSDGPVALSYVDGSIFLIMNKADEYRLAFGSASFADITDHWSRDYILFLANRGIMAGIGDNMAAPDLTVDRAAFITLLYRLIGRPEASGDLAFSDVKDGLWYTDAIRWAVANGIIFGYDEKTFGPFDSVSREQMCVIIDRYLQLAGISLGEPGETPAFNDDDAIAAYARDSIERLARAALVSGSGEGSFNPGKNSTRGEVASLLSRFIAKLLGR
ncbi:hypothetical protein MASR2M70_08480 [Bacillota bacterium]